MTDTVKKFIIDNKDLIAENNFDELYKIADYEFDEYQQIGELSQVFLDSKIDFTRYLTNIPDGLFWNTTGLKNIVIPHESTQIGYGAFLHTEVEKIEIPTSVKIIRPIAFLGCTNLQDITILNNVKVIGYSILKDCSRDLVITTNEGSHAHEYAIANNIKVKLV